MVHTTDSNQSFGDGLGTLQTNAIPLQGPSEMKKTKSASTQACQTPPAYDGDRGRESEYEGNGADDDNCDDSE
jgi:hypothetical protein